MKAKFIGSLGLRGTFASLAAGVFLTASAALARSDLRAQLIGVWHIEDQELSSSMAFFQDGSFEGSVSRAGKSLWKCRGSWRIAGRWLHYKYTESNLARIPPGTTDRDKVVDVSDDTLILEGEAGRETYKRSPSVQ